MGGYIKLDKDLVDDPRLLEFADVLVDAFTIQLAPGNRFSTPEEGWSERDARDAWSNALLGALMRLWRYADVHIRSDNTLPLSVTALSQVMRLPAWAIRLCPPEWLRIRDDGNVELPGYCEKNAIIARDLRRTSDEDRREQGRLRSQRFRAKWKKKRRNADRNASRVTPSRTRNGHTGTGTGTHPIPVPITGSSETGPPPARELASAGGRLARGDAQGNGKLRPRVVKSPSELEADARKLAGVGCSVPDIVRNLGQYGVTTAQVDAWLAEQPCS